MDTKKCSNCGTEKSVSEFSKRAKSTDGLQAWCKACNSSNRNQWLQIKGNKDKHRANNARYAAKVIKAVREIKESTPCADCGKNYPYYVMDFDHLRDKHFNISRMLGNGRIGLPRILAEIDKCEVVCSNCHRIRTHQRKLALDSETQGELDSL